MACASPERMETHSTLLGVWKTWKMLPQTPQMVRAFFAEAVGDLVGLCSLLSVTGTKLTRNATGVKVEITHLYTF